MTAKNLKHILALIALSYVVFMLGNNILSLTNPDEVFYVQTAKEMVSHNSWMTEYLFDSPQFEKPIFTYWLLRIGFILFGITSFAARFFPALFGIIGIIAVYLLGLLGFKDAKKAFFCSLVLMSSALYIGLSRTVFTDMIFTVLILLSLLAFYWGYIKQNRRSISVLLFFIAAAMAVLTKGPLGIAIPFLIVFLFLAIKRELKYLLSWRWVYGLIIFIVLALPWYLFMINRYGRDFIQEFFYNDHIRRLIEAEHLGNDTWYFYPASIIACMFPWSLYVAACAFFIFKGFLKRFRKKDEQGHLENNRTFFTFLICWAAVIFLIFQPAHSKLVSYIFPLFPAVAVICGGFIYDLAISKIRPRTLYVISFLTFVILLFFPVGLNISAAIYSIYVPNKIPIYAVSAVLLALTITFFLLTLKKKFLGSFYALACFIPVILFSMPFVHDYAEPYISSKQACEYLLSNYPVGQSVILCSKSFTRGVKFYTEKDVAVIDINGRNFFSPHPIPFLNTQQKLRTFLSRQPVTYCVLKKSYAKEINIIAGEDFKTTLLKVIGDEYIVRIERITSE